VKLYSLYGREKYLQKIKYIISILDKIKSNGYSGYCWGYNFDWQGRAGFTPKGTPTIVNTAFIAHAFLDAYELLREERLLETLGDSFFYLEVSTEDMSSSLGRIPIGDFPEVSVIGQFLRLMERRLEAADPAEKRVLEEALQRGFALLNGREA